MHFFLSKFSRKFKIENDLIRKIEEISRATSFKQNLLVLNNSSLRYDLCGTVGTVLAAALVESLAISGFILKKKNSPKLR